MTVNWDEPKYDGGSSVTGYIVEKKETTGKRWTRVTRDPIRALPLGNNWDVTGLLENSLYQFRLIAVNAAGCGLPSMPSDPVLCRDPISKTIVAAGSFLIKTLERKNLDMNVFHSAHHHLCKYEIIIDT